MLRLAALTALLLATQPSDAGVVSRDLFEPGDGLLTYDDVNQREWLAFSVARNLSLDQLSRELSDEGELRGFKLATGPDIVGLGNVTQLQATDWKTVDGSVLPYQQIGILASLVANGEYFVAERRASSFHNFLGPSQGGITSIDPDTVLVWSRHSFGYSGFFDPSLEASTFPWPGTSSAYWLYRDAAPVPEPTTTSLALAACFASLRLRALA